MERVSLMGLDIDAVTEDQAVERVVDGSLHDDEGGWVITPNLEHLREYQLDEDVRDALDEAELVLPDGAPLLWASRLKRDPLPARVAGSDLIWSLSRAAGSRGASLFLLGGSPGSAERAAERLEREYPGLRVQGTVCPPLGFEENPRLIDEMVSAVASRRPDVVLIGLPLRKHLVMARALREALPQAWLVGVGVSFSFVSGDTTRAPRWLQRVGMEWAHRLLQEPRRLFRRYVREGIPFALRLFTYAVLVRALSRLVRRPDLVQPRSRP
jgi:N-acetylglucosaminyldiphosphoundecaprenol N-acetyl-beta-D-mannosaminyltransferase